jgi:hypothetical protein
MERGCGERRGAGLTPFLHRIRMRTTHEAQMLDNFQPSTTTQSSSNKWGLLAGLGLCVVGLGWWFLPKSTAEPNPPTRTPKTSQDTTQKPRTVLPPRVKPASAPYVWNWQQPTSLPASGKEMKEFLAAQFARLEKRPNSFREVWTPGLAHAFQQWGEWKLAPYDYFLNVQNHVADCVGDAPPGFVDVGYIFDVDPETKVGTGVDLSFRESEWPPDILESVEACMREIHIGYKLDYGPFPSYFEKNGINYLAEAIALPIERNLAYQILLTDGQIIEVWEGDSPKENPNCKIENGERTCRYPGMKPTPNTEPAP